MTRYLESRLSRWLVPGLTFLLLGTMAGHAACQDAAQPSNRSVVVDGSGEFFHILDDTTLEAVHRLPLRSTLQGKPVISPDGHYLYFTTRDAWLTKFDLWRLQPAAEVRVGLQAINAVVSGDGLYVAAANLQPQTVTILDSNLNQLKVLSATSRDGKRASEVLAVHTAAARESFVVALKDIPEIWEISYNPTAPEIPMGVIHDFQYREGAFAPGFLNPMRTTLDRPLADYAFGADFNEVVIAPLNGKGDIVNLDARRKIASWDSTDVPRLSEGYAWTWKTHTVVAAPNGSQRAIDVIGVDDGKVVHQIPLAVEPAFIRSHEKSPYLWIGSSSDSRGTAQVAIVDKHALVVVGAWEVAPGSVLTDIVFSRDGRLVFVASTEKASSVTVYDTYSLKEIKRLTLSDSPTGRRSAATVVRQ